MVEASMVTLKSPAKSQGEFKLVANSARSLHKARLVLGWGHSYTTVKKKFLELRDTLV